MNAHDPSDGISGRNGLPDEARGAAEDAGVRNATEGGPARANRPREDTSVCADPGCLHRDAPPLVLVVDDEEVIRSSCRQILERSGCRVEVCADGVQALRRTRLLPVDLVLLDLRMPNLDGTELLARLRAEAPQLDVIVITGYSSVESAVDCMRLGAYDYLPKPFSAEALRLVVRRALEKRRLALENAELRRRLGGSGDGDGEILDGHSPAVRRIRETVRRVAPADSTVLIQGESGTGKELVARAIHRMSPRASRPFVAVDCGALADSLWASELFGHVRGAFTGAVSSRRGRFEEAEGGTIFLDEIANMDSSLQARLLRVLQEREVTRVGANAPVPLDVRVIAATNQDLRSALHRGHFREDLFYRFSVVTVQIPPLRDRREDIPVLVGSLVERICSRRGISARRVDSEALAALVACDWPGNARELQNTLERALLLCRDEAIGIGDLELADTPAGAWPDGGEPVSPKDAAAAAKDPSAKDPTAITLEGIEKEHILRMLEQTGWRYGRTAALLGIDRKTLWRKLRQYGVHGPDGGD